MIDSREGAIAWLDDHIGRGIRLGLDRMRDLMAVLGDPQSDYDVIHVAGTNGKTTVARVASSVLVAHGLRVGTTVSPHLERIEERTMLDLEPASPEEFVQSVSDLAAFVDLF
jgi:dihydrofolate synthase/folylpolyglutamate synthase